MNKLYKRFLNDPSSHNESTYTSYKKYPKRLYCQKMEIT